MGRVFKMLTAAALLIGTAACSSVGSATVTGDMRPDPPPTTTTSAVPAPTQSSTTTTVTPTTERPGRPGPVFPRLEGGCYSRPAYEYEALNMAARAPRWSRLADSPPLDLNRDGIPDELYSLGSQGPYGFDGHVQAYLGDQLGWTDLLSEVESLTLTIEASADLDGDGADEVLLSHQGNNFANMVVVELDGCDLRLAQDADFLAEKGFLLYCSSNSCLGETVRLDCIGEPGDHRMREHLIAVVPNQADAYKREGLGSPDWQYTIRDSSLVDGVMEVVNEESTVVLSDDPFPERWDHDHFVETCWG